MHGRNQIICHINIKKKKESTFGKDCIGVGGVRRTRWRSRPGGFGVVRRTRWRPRPRRVRRNPLNSLALMPWRVQVNPLNTLASRPWRVRRGPPDSLPLAPWRVRRGPPDSLAPAPLASSVGSAELAGRWSGGDGGRWGGGGGPIILSTCSWMGCCLADSVSRPERLLGVTAAGVRSKVMGSTPPVWRPELTRSTFG